MIYFDNSATTPIHQEVFSAMIPYLTTEYGNPSSKYYLLSTKAKEAVEYSRTQVANLIGAKPEEIIFTSGSTESTNLIIKGVADFKKYYEQKGSHIITSQAEHKATINTCMFLNGEIYSNKDAIFTYGSPNKKIDRGYEVTFLNVDEYGKVNPDTLLNAIKQETVIASIIWGNNEIGTINDINSLGDICKNRSVLFHTDATQVLGKNIIDVKQMNVDFMSVSAHKIYGPKGVGAAYIKEDDYGKPPISSLIHGGEQEEGIRGGTLAVHNIVGFGKAAEIALKQMNQVLKFYTELDTALLKLFSERSDIRLLGDLENKLPGIYSLIIDKPDFNNERFLKKVSQEFALSSGSACTAGQPSHVLNAIGLGNYTNRVIRISIGYSDNLDVVISQIKDLLGRI